MHTYNSKIRLMDTDATGVLYFAQQFRLALEAFEDYLEQKERMTLHHLIHQSDFLMPIVHAEGDYTLPLKVGTAVTIGLSLTHIGTTSFTIASTMQTQEGKAGGCKIVHVTVSKETGRPIPIPEALRQVLQEMSGSS